MAFILAGLVASAQAYTDDSTGLLQTAKVAKTASRQPDPAPQEPFEERGGRSDVLPCSHAGVIFTNMEEDCTNQDMFEWKGAVQGEFVAPTYNPSQYGRDVMWETSKTNATAGWETLCVAYVNTKEHGKTCKQWCEDQSTPEHKLVCNKGMDDAHRQSDRLYEWLESEDYPPTKCTLNKATRYLTKKISTGKPIDQSGNGCNAEWDTQICGCALVRPPSPPPSQCVWAKAPLEDCTETDHLNWKGDIRGWTPPSYSPTIYGSDEFWTTKQGLGSGVGRWPGACVAYVRTDGKTCTEWCGAQDMTCVGGMDDAHHQQPLLNEWQSLEGSTPTKCTLFEKGHTRQTTANNGCEQTWSTQICACK